MNQRYKNLSETLSLLEKLSEEEKFNLLMCLAARMGMNWQDAKDNEEVVIKTGRDYNGKSIIH